MERKKRNTKKKNEKKVIIRTEMKQAVSTANTPGFFGCFLPPKEELKEDKNGWLLSEGHEEGRNSQIIKGSD